MGVSGFPRPDLLMQSLLNLHTRLVFMSFFKEKLGVPFPEFDDRSRCLAVTAFDKDRQSAECFMENQGLASLIKP